MKKLFITFAVIFIVFGLVACNADAKQEAATRQQLNSIVESIQLPATTTADLPLPTNSSINPLVVFAWSSSNEQVISVTGGVNRQASDVDIILTLFVSLGDITVSRSFTISVTGAPAFFTQQMTDMINQVTLPQETKGDLTLLTSDSTNPSVIFTWSSSNEQIITTTGIVNLQADDVVVILTLDLSLNDIIVSRTFTIKVLGVTNATARQLTNLINQIALPVQTISDLTLPTSDSDNPEIIFAWSSSVPTVISNAGVVSRRTVNVDVYLTLQLTLDNQTVQRTFKVTVIADGEIQAEDLTVTYMVDSSVTIDYRQVLVQPYAKIAQQPRVAKPGYFLVGWFTDINLTEHFSFNMLVKTNLYLYPKWRATDNNQTAISNNAFLYNGFMMDHSQYYQSINGLTGNDLKMELRSIISVMNPVTYGDARAVLARSDRDYRTNYSTVRGIYNNTVMVPFWQPSANGGVWQREHVWPQSKLGAEASNTRANIASDLHNLRAIDGVNQTRGNRYFLDPLTNTSNWALVGTTAFFPGNDHKGDVARILLYMVVRYPQLTLSNDATQAANTSALTMGILDTLLRWHRQDPPDRFEIERNEFIYSHNGPQNAFNQVDEFRHISGLSDFSTIRPQGNRNPFIDKPELVHLIWEGYEIIDLVGDVTAQTSAPVTIIYLVMPNRFDYVI